MALWLADGPEGDEDAGLEEYLALKLGGEI